MSSAPGMEGFVRPPKTSVREPTRQGPHPNSALLPLALVCAVAAGLLAAPLVAQSDSTEPSQYELRQGWFSRDKAYHFGISGVGAAGVYALGREIGLGKWSSAAGAAVVMGTVGFLRETLAFGDPNDTFTRSTFSRRDMFWNVMGIGVGISVTDLLLRERWIPKPVPVPKIPDLSTTLLPAPQPSHLAIASLHGHHRPRRHEVDPMPPAPVALSRSGP